MRDTSERVAGTAKGNHQLRRRRTEEGGTRHGKPQLPVGAYKSQPRTGHTRRIS